MISLQRTNQCQHGRSSSLLVSRPCSISTVTSCFSLSDTLLVGFACNASLINNIDIILVAPVFWFSQPALGGYGFSPFLISIFLGAAGLSQAIWLLLAFPPLQHRFGTGGVLRGCSIVWPITFIFAALGTLFLRHNWKAAFWIVLPLNTAIGSGVSMAFSK